VLDRVGSEIHTQAMPLLPDRFRSTRREPPGPFPRIRDMRNPSVDDTACGFSPMIALLAVAALGAALLWSVPTPVAQAKGPVKLTFCGKRACVDKSAPRFAAAMLYGGRSHAGPVCRARVHTVTAVMPGSELARRFLVLASRGLV